MEQHSGRHAKRPASATDALTSLPVHLLDDILTRLDLCDLVRTSALSRAWRFRWESLPALSLCFLDSPHTPPEVVDGVLLRYAGRISHFSFRLNPESASRNYCWLIALSRRRVESMDLRNSRGDVLFQLHSSIFSCVNLVALELHDCYFPPVPPGFSGFPSLEELKLWRVQFVDDTTDKLEAIFRRSPLLQLLNLTCVDVGSGTQTEEQEWVIPAPNLRSLTIISANYYGWRFGKLLQLADATINIDSYVEQDDFGELLAGIA